MVHNILKCHAYLAKFLLVVQICFFNNEAFVIQYLFDGQQDLAWVEWFDQIVGDL
jgi:hypothetical protein